MKEKSTVITSASGLSVGCLLGMAGSIVPSDSFRNVAWAVDAAGIILAGALLCLYYFRKGYDALGAGFLVLAIGETVIFSSGTTSPDQNISSLAAGYFLWATAIAFISLQKNFPLFVRITGIIASILFAIVAIRGFTGHPVGGLEKPLPYFAYPFYAATLVGWAWTLVRQYFRLSSRVPVAA